MDYKPPVIGIHGVPRSGTSWTLQLLNSHPNTKIKFQPLFSYPLKNFLDFNFEKSELDDFYNQMWRNDNNLFLNGRDPEIHRGYPKFKKENQDRLIFKQIHHHFLLPRFMKVDPSLKLVLLIRNPFSVLSSWKKAPREFNPSWDFKSEWKLASLKNEGKIENYFGFEKWKEATMLFLNLHEEYPDRVLLIDYSKLIKNKSKLVSSIFQFCQLGNLGEQTTAFLNQSTSSHSKDPNSVFKSKIDDFDTMVSFDDNIKQSILSDDFVISLYNQFNWPLDDKR